ncbi:hypothetical protein M3Y96_00640300 [Aphelenchoides besseyi]|nr:hypothetical protein M3Y96_00640300 [Aphelenchoides besseyi]
MSPFTRFWRHRRIISAFCILSLVFTASRLFEKQQQIPTVLQHYHELLRHKSQNWKSCDVPVLDEWDKSILKYYEKPKQLECKRLQQNLTFVDPNGFLRVDPTTIASYNCEYRYVFYQENNDFEPKYEIWQPLEESIKLQHDFVEVRCKKTGLLPISVYNYNHAHVVPKLTSNLTGRKIALESTKRPSVIVIGLDSMSRSNFLRQLPNTWNTLKQKFTTFNHHVKVADNTYSNLLAILTGKRAQNTTEFKAELKDTWGISFDDFPIIWQEYSTRDYASFFAEDRPDIGTFNYKQKLNGFLRQPTDHYIRPFFLNLYHSLLHRRSSYGCYGNIAMHEHMIHYLESFLVGYKNKRKFALFWSQDLSHDFLNRIGVIDQDLSSLFVRAENLMENSIVIVVSDHGHRFDPIRDTTVGRFETRLPFLAIRLPDKFSEQYPHLKANLQRNAQIMTTQFDLYSTLKHILEGDFRNTNVSRNKEAHGHSLLGIVPENRTCFEAQIPDEFCPCVNEISIPVEEGVQAANVLLDYINQKTVEYEHFADGTKCLELELETIKELSARVPPANIVVDPYADNRVTKDAELKYRIVIQAKAPSNAVLEASVAYKFEEETWEIRKYFCLRTRSIAKESLPLRFGLTNKLQKCCQLIAIYLLTREIKLNMNISFDFSTNFIQTIEYTCQILFVHKITQFKQLMIFEAQVFAAPQKHLNTFGR